jgi:hypothetical protein
MAMMRGSGRAGIDLHDAVVARTESGATMSISGATAHPEARLRADDALPRHQLELRVFGSHGQLVVDFERAMVWRSASGRDDERLPLDEDAGRYSCEGPPEALIELAGGVPGAVDRAPGELGARTVDLLAAAYRSAAGGELIRLTRAPG